MIKGIDHITINVEKLQESLDFYGHVLQLSALPSVDMGDHHLYYFSLPEAGRLELITYQESLTAQHPDVKTPGLYRHFALLTDDISAVFARCRQYGVNILSEPAWVEALQFHGMLIQDPNGVEIEIVQRPA